MHYVTINTPVVRDASPAMVLTFPTPARADAESVVEHLVQRDVLAPDSRAARHLRTIFSAPPEALRVGRIVRRMYTSRRTLGRHFRAAGLPSPMDWVAIARAVCAHRTIARGGKLREAACAGGYPDQFTMSNAIHRITGLRPSKLRDVSWAALLDIWIARQREHGALTGPPTPGTPTCALCGAVRAN